MANSTTNLDLISSGQANKELTANELFDAASPATLFGRRASTTALLTFGFYGGNLLGLATPIANGTISLIPSTTNYVEFDTTLNVVSRNNIAYTSGFIPLYRITTNATTQVSWFDDRPSPLVGSNYTLPTASTSVLGGVKVDGITVTIDGTGTISSAGGGGGGGSDPFETGLVAFTKADGISNTASSFGANFAYTGQTNIDTLETSLSENLNKFRLSTSAVLNSTAGVRNAGMLHYREGFTTNKSVINFSITDTTSDYTVVAGWHGSENIAFTFPNLTGLNNFIGCGFNDTDANLQFLFTNSSNVLQKVDLGTNFPARTSGAFYRLTIEQNKATTGDVTVKIERLDVAFSYVNTITSPRPINGTGTASGIVTKIFINTGIAAIRNMRFHSMYLKQTF